MCTELCRLLLCMDVLCRSSEVAMQWAPLSCSQAYSSGLRHVIASLGLSLLVSKKAE